MNKDWFLAKVASLPLIVSGLLLILSNSLLLTTAGCLPRVAGAMLFLLLPGLAWGESWQFGRYGLLGWIISLGLSYVLVNTIRQLSICGGNVSARR